MKKIALSLLIIGLLAMSIPGNVQAFNVPVNLNVGDVFKVKISQASAEHKINGTSYLDSDQAELEQIPVNEIAEMKVTAIFDEGSETKVNATGSIGDIKIEGTTTVDSWTGGMVVLLFLLLADAFFDPDNYDFSAPTTGTTVTSLDKVEPLPIFASSNETEYKEIVSEVSNTTSTTTTTSTNSNITVSQETIDATYDENTKIFTFDIMFEMTNHGTNSRGENWNTLSKFVFHAKIDVSKSFVFEYTMEFKHEVHIGDGSEVVSMGLAWEKADEEGEGGGILDKLPGFELYIALTALLALPIILKKYRT